jgi:P27 family predicted phage terminase small subunit
LNKAEPQFLAPDGVPYAPRVLSEEAKKEWRRIVRVLLEANLYTEADRAALMMYCQAWGRWLEAEKQLEATGGPILVSEKGGLYQNLWLSVAQKAAAEVRRLISEFGLTPASRSRVTAGAGGEVPSMAELLQAEIHAVKKAGGKR